MRRNFPVTGKECPVGPADRLVSTTTKKGVITHVNDTFCRISGFTRDELMGQAHNIVRHPDMPPAVFDDLWRALKANKSWMGIVKNRCKNGDHYWVNAFITPVFERQEVVGYQSVRSMATREQINRAEQLYAQISKTGAFQVKPLAAASRWMPAKDSALLLAGVLVGSALTIFDGVAGGLLVGAATSAAAVSGYVATARIRQLQRVARSTHANSVSEYIYGGGRDEVGSAIAALSFLEARGQTLLGRIENFSDYLLQAASEAESAATRGHESAVAQREEIEQLAAATEETAAAAQEVARNAAAAADAAREGVQCSQQGREVVEEATAAMRELADEVEAAAGSIERLRGDGDSVRKVLEVISGITEQTNLLALNAAIEAARSGESGRGFAVVAGEVRSLAGRTARSADEIAEILDRLQSGAADAGTVMARGREVASQAGQLAERAGRAINEVEAAVKGISGMNLQIAGAAEEQTSVSEQVANNIHAINQRVGYATDAAEATSRTGHKLVNMVEELRGMLKQFSP